MPTAQIKECKMTLQTLNSDVSPARFQICPKIGLWLIVAGHARKVCNNYIQGGIEVFCETATFHFNWDNKNKKWI